MLTKLNVSGLGLPHASKLITPDQLASRVREKQSRSKQYCDTKCSAKNVSFYCGSYVCVKKPGIVPKMQSKFGKPLKVVGKKGLYIYKLSDGRCWNASYLALVIAPCRTDMPTELPLFDSLDTEPKVAKKPAVVTRPVWSRRAPAWTQDYAM